MNIDIIYLFLFFVRITVSVRMCVFNPAFSNKIKLSILILLERIPAQIKKELLLKIKSSLTKALEEKRELIRS